MISMILNRSMVLVILMMPVNASVLPHAPYDALNGSYGPCPSITPLSPMIPIISFRIPTILILTMAPMIPLKAPVTCRTLMDLPDWLSDPVEPAYRTCWTCRTCSPVPTDPHRTCRTHPPLSPDPLTNPAGRAGPAYRFSQTSLPDPLDPPDPLTGPAGPAYRTRRTRPVPPDPL
jgi:hypothetical protein